jgi:hypothetical protein
LNPLAAGISLQKPPHDPVPLRAVPCRIVAQWPAGTFVENLLPRVDGTVWVTVHSTHELIEVDPADGAMRVVAKFPAPCAGIVEAYGAVFVNVGEIGQPGAAVYRVGPDGNVENWVDIPEGLFLNGAARMAEDRLLVGDAILGKVFLVDLAAKTAKTWLADPLLQKVTAEPRSTATTPIFPIPTARSSCAPRSWLTVRRGGWKRSRSV